MALISDCPACLVGYHGDHDPTYGCKPGLIGGMYCACTGDCLPRFTARVAELDRLLGQLPDQLPEED